jgi:hypothetical protein
MKWMGAPASEPSSDRTAAAISHQTLLALSVVEAMTTAVHMVVVLTL